MMKPDVEMSHQTHAACQLADTLIDCLHRGLGPDTLAGHAAIQRAWRFFDRVGYAGVANLLLAARKKPSQEQPEREGANA